MDAADARLGGVRCVRRLEVEHRGRLARQANRLAGTETKSVRQLIGGDGLLFSWESTCAVIWSTASCSSFAIAGPTKLGQTV